MTVRGTLNNSPFALSLSKGASQELVCAGFRGACFDKLSTDASFSEDPKRIDFATATLFLQLNGVRLGATAVDALIHTLMLADGEMSEADYTAWLKASSKRA
ncbi:MAG: hypothetical protein ACREPT_03740 [Rudaea sp.]